MRFCVILQKNKIKSIMEHCNGLKPNDLSKGGRIAYIDALRGFTMLLVVFWHVEYVAYGEAALENVIDYIFKAFRMPTFFFISGFIAYKAVDRWNTQFFVENLRKKALVQLIPTIVFFSLMCFYMGNSPLQFFETGFQEFWFTFVLFEMFVLYYALSFIGRYTSGAVVDLGLVVLLIAGRVILEFGAHQWWRVLNLWELFTYFQFFAFGILCRKYSNIFMNCVKSDRFRLSAIFVFVVGLVLCFDKEFKVAMPQIYKVISEIVVRYAGLLLVFIFFYSKAAYFESGAWLSRVMQFVGRRTLDIYMLHYFMIPAIHSHKITYLAPFISTESMAITRFAVSMGIAILVVASCLLVSEVIRTSPTLAHYLFGAKRK